MSSIWVSDGSWKEAPPFAGYWILNLLISLQYPRNCLFEFNYYLLTYLSTPFPPSFACGSLVCIWKLMIVLISICAPRQTDLELIRTLQREGALSTPQNQSSSGTIRWVKLLVCWNHRKHSKNTTHIVVIASGLCNFQPLCVTLQVV